MYMYCVCTALLHDGGHPADAPHDVHGHGTASAELLRVKRRRYFTYTNTYDYIYIYIYMYIHIYIYIIYLYILSGHPTPASPGNSRRGGSGTAAPGCRRR